MNKQDNIFVACEQGLKAAALKEKDNNNELVDMLTQAINHMNNTLSSIDKRISKLEEQSSQKKLPEKKYSRWKTNAFIKLNSLMTYVNIHLMEKLQLSEIIRQVIIETEDTYNIEISDYVAAYKSEFELNETPYVIDVINYYKDIQDMFTLTLNSIMERLNIADNVSSHKKNIFDELIKSIN